MNIEGPTDVHIGMESPRSAEARKLIDDLDSYQTALYPAESNHLLEIDSLCADDVRFLVARRAGAAVGCGALLVHIGQRYGEIKRMFVRPEMRGLTIGQRILFALESCARREGLTHVRLETGVEQPEAIRLYTRAGYHECGAFGSYKPDPLSIFMEKSLR